jgi:hypothetical protein
MVNQNQNIKFPAVCLATIHHFMFHTIVQLKAAIQTENNETCNENIFALLS